MKTINLTKYGFERCSLRDFTVDGVRHTAYKVGRMIITKSKNKLVGTISLQTDPDLLRGYLTLDEYRSLPHFSSIQKYFSFKPEEFKEEDIEELYKNICCYQSEYEELEEKVHKPTLVELTNYYEHIKQARLAEYNKIISEVKNNLEAFLNTKDYRRKYIIENLKLIKKRTEVNPTEQAKVMHSVKFSRELLFREAEVCSASWNYEAALEEIGIIAREYESENKKDN